MKTILIKNSVIVPMSPDFDVIKSDIFIKDGYINKIQPNLKTKADIVFDNKNHIILPGFIQTHVHLCQTLFRGMAEESDLLIWLRKRIWPLEAMHTPETLYYTSLLGCAELLRCGTTCVLVMGTVHYTDSIFNAIKDSGIRGFSGKAMMDSGDNIPSGLKENTGDSINESIKLIRKWHKTESGRINYALAPRFVLSCSQKLLKKVGEISKSCGLIVHTHASENRKETILISKKYGVGNIEYLNKLNLLSSKTVLAHCVWLNKNHVRLLKNKHTAVAHCPSANLKLGSGIANIRNILDNRINVTLGADGVPCNNNLNVFTEMRLAGLVARYRDITKIVSAKEIIGLTTINAARALGLDKEIGSIEVGKKADIIILNLDLVSTTPYDLNDIYTTIVYSAGVNNLVVTIINGEVVFYKDKVLFVNETEVKKRINKLVGKFRL